MSPVGEASPAFSGKEEEEQQQHEGQTKEEEEETEDFNIGRLEVLEKLLKDIQDDTFSTLYQSKFSSQFFSSSRDNFQVLLK